MTFFKKESHVGIPLSLIPHNLVQIFHGSSCNTTKVQMITILEYSSTTMGRDLTEYRKYSFCNFPFNYLYQLW